ncbi:MAG: sulfatase-like hydrolase/transferase, partial [Clostridia bacterium]|nr:sulfatase-like hydrolase/transferase [Clostridia bacterium]
SHGNYPADIEEKRNISVFGAENEILKAEYEYYVNEISEVDMFIGALISYLESFDEPTVLVLYGDHLPAFTEIDDSDLSAGNMFTSEYVIWSNYGLSGEDKDLETYQLTSYLFELLNINEGLFFEFHDIYETSYIYDDLLEQLEYDILYGENYAKVSYEPMPMTVGFDDIEITSATVLGESLYVKGNNFTEYSVIYINGIAKNTVYISDEVLMTEDVSVEEEINVEIKQIAADGYRYN